MTKTRRNAVLLLVVHDYREDICSAADEIVVIGDDGVPGKVLGRCCIALESPTEDGGASARNHFARQGVPVVEIVRLDSREDDIVEAIIPDDEPARYRAGMISLLDELFLVHDFAKNRASLIGFVAAIYLKDAAPFQMKPGGEES